MAKWSFPSRGYGDLEGFSNPGLEFFKGAPIRAMAREVCQNSLDAKRDNNAPVRVEFERYFKKVSDFPGILELRQTLDRCYDFWKTQGDERTISFIKDAIKIVNDNNIFVLRIGDYNTTGLKGAFSEDGITPWKGLVQGNAFSIKSSETAAGSFGIGKAAPFVVSKLQTVFYRTFDEEGVRAAQGVTHLVSFKDDNAPIGEDPVRRSTGYYGAEHKNKPLTSIPLLDALNRRDEYGTDLFIPGFNATAARADDWVDDIIIEVLENFLYSIYARKLEVVIDKRVINRDTVAAYITRYMPKTKGAKAFYEVIREDNEDVIEEELDFHSMGSIRLRLLYKPDQTKKILVVRNSGMKISNIPSLPKSISFVGFLEIRGDGLNKFFRGMENPEHNKWEPSRHSNPGLAATYKSEVEDWVKTVICDKIKEITGDEMDIDMSSYFFSANREEEPSQEEERIEAIVDTVKTIDVIQFEPTPKSFKVRDLGGDGEPRSDRMRPGVIDDKGSKIGHRRPDGKRRRGAPTGRQGVEHPDGNDRIYDGMHEVSVRARIIKRSGAKNRLIFTAAENITRGELEIVTVGENGKPLQLVVKNANGINIVAMLDEGHLVVSNVPAGEKSIVEFEIAGDKDYAMGVRAYGN